MADVEISECIDDFADDPPLPPAKKFRSTYGFLKARKKEHWQPLEFNPESKFADAPVVLIVPPLRMPLTEGADLICTNVLCVRPCIVVDDKAGTEVCSGCGLIVFERATAPEYADEQMLAVAPSPVSLGTLIASGRAFNSVSSDAIRRNNAPLLRFDKNSGTLRKLIAKAAELLLFPSESVTQIINAAGKLADEVRKRAQKPVTRNSATENTAAPDGFDDSGLFADGINSWPMLAAASVIVAGFVFGIGIRLSKAIPLLTAMHQHAQHHVSVTKDKLSGDIVFHRSVFSVSTKSPTYRKWMREVAEANGIRWPLLVESRFSAFVQHLLDTHLRGTYSVKQRIQMKARVMRLGRWLMRRAVDDRCEHRRVVDCRDEITKKQRRDFAVPIRRWFTQHYKDELPLTPLEHAKLNKQVPARVLTFSIHTFAAAVVAVTIAHVTSKELSELRSSCAGTLRDARLTIAYQILSDQAQRGDTNALHLLSQFTLREAKPAATTKSPTSDTTTAVPALLVAPA